MSLLLSLIEDLNREMYNASLYDHDFGYGLHPQQIHPVQTVPHPVHHHHLQREPTICQLLGLRPPTHHHRAEATAHSNENALQPTNQKMSPIGKDGFQACIDVQQFKPNELSVKVVGNSILVEGKHEEREDNHGYISRHFVRRYTLPEDYDPERVMSTLSSDGILTINIPKPVTIEDAACERIIQIHQTGPAHLNVKSNSQVNAAAVVGESESNGEK